MPRIGNNWGECDPGNPRNRRSRVSVLVEDQDYRVLIDTSPDLRSQFLDNEIDRVDAVLWTHDHADHCHGIDDLRGLFRNTKRRLLGFARPYTTRSLLNRFSYVFSGNKGYPALVDLNSIGDQDMAVSLGPFELFWTDQPHGPVQSTGFILTSGQQAIGYATDFSGITAAMVECYMECDILVVDALRRDPHPTHAHLAMSIDLARQCRARQTVLTHMDISMDYDQLVTECPDGIVPGYDGMTLWT